MAKEKMMNETRFSKMVDEFDSLGELVKTRQDEKQSVMDEFDKERKRFHSGKISENTVGSSAKKTNKEMAKLNNEIRNIISRANKMANSMKEFVSSQSPKIFSARVSGITLNASKKKVKRKAQKRTKKTTSKVTRKRVSKRKAPSTSTTRRKREIALDKKYQK